ncbi:phosphoribosyltransferase [Cryptosporangium sp. NPDC051539]|uniref:phosphoribosyltransferase n=1 Tax=Cryptosporangium sp. NPDC051539 TaxID=3363962 RepID=UPI0037B23B93
MSLDDTIKLINTLTVLFAALSITLSLRQYIAGRRKESLAEIIKGEKEEAAVAAIRIRNDKKAPSIQELQALCLASVFERSGRTRSLIYGTLLEEQKRFPEEIRDILDQIAEVVARNAAYTDLTRARRRLISLRAALSLDGDTRTRVDIVERYTASARRDNSNACGCVDRAHCWSSLRQPLSSVGSLVLVCRTKENDSPEQDQRTLGVPLIALDYHRTAAGDLTAIGRTLVSEKYVTNRRPNPPGIRELVAKMTTVVRHVDAYKTAEAVVAVPGTEHSYSDELGAMLGRAVGKPLIPLSRSTGSLTLDVDPSSVSGRRIILVDDVFRTGRTFRDAASILFIAGAQEIVGLAATCTISKVEVPCHQWAPATPGSSC